MTVGAVTVKFKFTVFVLYVVLGAGENTVMVGGYAVLIMGFAVPRLTKNDAAIKTAKGIEIKGTAKSFFLLIAITINYRFAILKGCLYKFIVSRFLLVRFLGKDFLTCAS